MASESALSLLFLHREALVATQRFSGTMQRIGGVVSSSIDAVDDPADGPRKDLVQS